MNPGQLLIGLVMLLFIGALVVVVAPIGIVVQIAEALRYRWFLRREAGRLYLVCTTRRNWHDFTRNNLIPVLPDHYRVLWRLKGRGGGPSIPFAEFTRTKTYAIPKPYLVLVTPRGLAHRSLNAVLAEQKRHQERSEQVRALCRETIDRIEKELRASPENPARA